MITSSKKNQENILIGNLKISYANVPAIIAEIGINHGGSLDEAKHLADLAAESGADIIKSQFHIPHEEMFLWLNDLHTKSQFMKLSMIVVALMKSLNSSAY